MITSLQDYINSLRKISAKETVEFILLHLKGNIEVVASSKPLNNIFYKPGKGKEVLDLMTKDCTQLARNFSKEGRGIAFFGPDSIKGLAFEIDYVILYSHLENYTSLLFLRKSSQKVCTEKSLCELLNLSKIILLRYDTVEKKINFISSSLKQILGYSEEQILNKSFDECIELVHPDDRKQIQELVTTIGTMKLKSTPHVLEFSVKNNQGIYQIIQFSAILDNVTGKHQSILFSAQDITGSRKTEKSLIEIGRKLEKAENELITSNTKLDKLNERLEKHDREMEKTYDRLSESEKMLRQLAESTNDIIWLRNDKEILYINNQFERIWGRSMKEFIDNPCKITDWIHPDDLSNVEPWVNLESLAKGTPFVEQYRILRPDGKIRWIWSRIFPVLDKEGKTYRLVGIASDITEQKEFEEALRIAKEKAQESDLLKSTFLANISHEIRTPMNGIVGFAELISREDIDPQTRKNYVSIMKKSSDQLICIIDDIIDFAKLEANQIRIVQETLDINKLLEELYIFYDNQLKKKQIDAITLLYEKTLEDKKAKVISDENRLRQVLSYLLDNAIKFTSEGFIKFGYKLVGGKIEFYIQDSGIGIPPDKHDHIFERFRQVDEGHTRRYGGTGLGLPISKGLVNLLGGQIWLESEPDKGSTFFFTIPYRIETGIEKEGKQVLSGEQKYSWKNKIILVAEDDELNFEYIKVLLEPTDAKLIRAKDGSQVVKICSNLNFDLILMDIRLPVLNGIQATKQLREMGIHTPIIAQTAFAMDDDEQRCLSAGCNCYIAKPISKDKLYSLIDQFI